MWFRFQTFYLTLAGRGANIKIESTQKSYNLHKCLSSKKSALIIVLLIDYDGPMPQRVKNFQFAKRKYKFLKFSYLHFEALP